MDRLPSSQCTDTAPGLSGRSGLELTSPTSVHVIEPYNQYFNPHNSVGYYGETTTACVARVKYATVRDAVDAVAVGDDVGRTVENRASVSVHGLAGARSAQVRRGIHRLRRSGPQDQRTIWSGRTNHRSLQVCQTNHYLTDLQILLFLVFSNW